MFFPQGGWQSLPGKALTSLAAAASIEVAVPAQEAALPVGPAVVEAGGEVRKNRHFGFGTAAFPARTAHPLGVTGFGTALCSAPMVRPCSSVQAPVFQDLLHPPRSQEQSLLPHHLSCQTDAQVGVRSPQTLMADASGPVSPVLCICKPHVLHRALGSLHKKSAGRQTAGIQAQLPAP